MKRILRFLISGGSAATVEYVSFILLSFILMSPVVLANSVSFFCGFIVSFTLNKYWVFKNNDKLKGQLTAYLILAIVNLCISNLVIIGLIHIGVIELIAKVFAMVAIASWNYLFFSKYIFKEVKSTR